MPDQYRPLWDEETYEGEEDTEPLFYLSVPVNWWQRLALWVKSLW